MFVRLMIQPPLSTLTVVIYEVDVLKEGASFTGLEEWPIRLRLP